ncbi:alpha/beta hydrolase [Sphingomonas oligophenolica]|uniref:Alpha/beta hydrolase n=1 Tax=Sphingomonas oligophenolica TaxID=301154 RepID=A0ABU9XY54_9SPHN
MTIDPRAYVAKELLPGLDVIPTLDLNDESIVQFRGMIALASLEVPPEVAVVTCEERFVPGSPDAPDVRILLYVPPGAADSPRPAYLHIHGGGYVLGRPELNDLSNRAMALTHGCVVVSVAYRLAPEASFPAARDDCYAALAWLHREAASLGVDPARIAIGGESAGGGHAAALALHARDFGQLPICFMLLDSPMLDDRTGSTIETSPHFGQLVWTAGLNRYGWKSMLGREPGGDDIPAEAVPARCADMSGLPPAFIVVGALDLFLLEDLAFAAGLASAGVPVELHVVPGAYHGFGAAGPAAPQVQMAQSLRQAALARAFAGS